MINYYLHFYQWRFYLRIIQCIKTYLWHAHWLGVIINGFHWISGFSDIKNIFHFFPRDFFTESFFKTSTSAGKDNIQIGEHSTGSTTIIRISNITQTLDYTNIWFLKIKVSSSVKGSFCNEMPNTYIYDQITNKINNLMIRFRILGNTALFTEHVLSTYNWLSFE